MLEASLKLQFALCEEPGGPWPPDAVEQVARLLLRQDRPLGSPVAPQAHVLLRRRRDADVHLG